MTQCHWLCLKKWNQSQSEIGFTFSLDSNLGMMLSEFDQSIWQVFCFIAYDVQVNRTLSLEKKTSDDHRADDLLQLQTNKILQCGLSHGTTGMVIQEHLA